jgi:hypothetical protein
MAGVGAMRESCSFSRLRAWLGAGASQRVSTLVAAALLMALWAQALGAAGACSVAFDEPYHLADGYAYLRTGDPRLSTHQPALVDTWLAVPLLLLDLHLPLDSPSWQQAIHGRFGDEFLWQANSAQAVKAVWLGRLANVGVALILGAAIFRWSTEFFGKSGGLFALALYSLDPGVVANAALATNDLGVAALVFLATWAWWKWLGQPSGWRLILAGVAAGAACASKSSGLIVGPIAAVLALVRRPLEGRRGVNWLQRLGGLAGNGVLCCATIWAVYGFSFGDGVPAPAYVEGIKFQSGRLVESLPVYALGRIWPDSVWFYYPLTLLLKTPLPVMLTAAIGVAVAIKRRGRELVCPLLIPPLLFGAMAVASALQQGHRVLLPILPFLFCLGGAVTLALPWSGSQLRRAARAAAAALPLAWLAFNAFSIYPHHLSFFNELAGGAAEGDRYLVDANIDWGQDLPALRETMAELGIPRVYLGYFGTAIPDLYGIEYYPAPGFLRFIEDLESRAFNPYSPEPGWYAISVTSLRQGLLPTHTDLYSYFWSQAVEARAGYSIDLYQVSYSPSTAVVRAVVQDVRVANVPREQLGWEEGERLIAKLAPDPDTFVLAMNGPARYVVQDLLPYAPSLRDAVLGQARQHSDGALEFDAGRAAQPVLEAWSEASQLYVPGGEALGSPIAFDGGLALLGYYVEGNSVAAGQTLSLVLAWRVNGDLVPGFATFVHLLDGDGRLVAQRDGWGCAVLGLEAGDVVVQHVHLAVPADTAPGEHRLQVGAYWRSTMARWSAQAPRGARLDRIWLQTIEVNRVEDV